MREQTFLWERFSHSGVTGDQEQDANNYLSIGSARCILVQVIFTQRSNATDFKLLTSAINSPGSMFQLATETIDNDVEVITASIQNGDAVGNYLTYSIAGSSTYDATGEIWVTLRY
jgi:hypothetical protein